MLQTTKDRYTLFAMSYVNNGFNGAQAARDVGYKESSARQTACHLLTNDYIKQEIARLKGVNASKAGFTIEDAHDLYFRAYKLAERIKKPAPMAQAATGIARLYGYDKDSGGGREQTIIIIGPKAPAKAIESVPVASDKQIEGD